MNTLHAGTPAADIEVDTALVRRLLAAQHPDLAALPLEAFEAGWDNAMFRLGAEWAVRLPRRLAAAHLLQHEQRWLPELADRLPIPVPAPWRIGHPGEGYPWHWSVLPWLPGVASDLMPPDASQAVPFARFLRALHVAAPTDAPLNPVRGVPLARRAAVVEERLQRLEARTALVTPAVRRAWQQALDAPWDGETTWIHGDLHARNVLVDHAAISGIIDWGDMARGDRATDLAAFWIVLPDADARRAAIDAYADASDALWARALGWAVLFGSVLLDTGLADHPRHARIGELTLRRVAQSA